MELIFFSQMKPTVTSLHSIFVTVLFLAQYPGVTSKHLESVNRIVCGAAPLPKSDIDKVLSKVKVSKRTTSILLIQVPIYFSDKHIDIFNNDFSSKTQNSFKYMD